VYKSLNDPSLNTFEENTKISCALTNLIDKSKINFNIYDIATNNKDIVIKNTSDIPLTVEQIENNYQQLYAMDKDNSVIISEFTNLLTSSIEPSYEFKLNLYSSFYNYTQKLFTKEETSKKFVYFPDEIFSSPPILNISNFKPGFSKYMKFTYDSDIDKTQTRQTEYTITLNDDYKYIVDILVVGGGGGTNIVSGGGAGSIVYIVNKTLAAGTYKIIVGKGGTEGTNGSDSMITFENNNIITLDGITVKANGGECGQIIGDENHGGNGGYGGGIPSNVKQATFWNGKSYVMSGFEGANGGNNYGGGGGGSLSKGEDIKGGGGNLINITGNDELYGNGGNGARLTFGSNGNSDVYEGIDGNGVRNPGSGGSVSYSFRTRTVVGSAGMPGIVIISYRTESYNCIISDWTACDNRSNTRTRTRTITRTRTQSICTLEENALPLTQTCNNCTISDWIPCNGNNCIRTRIRTQSINGTPCTLEENALLLTEISNVPTTKATNYKLFVLFGFIGFIALLCFLAFIFRQK
jgi:hypothetical protein